MGFFLCLSELLEKLRLIRIITCITRIHPLSQWKSTRIIVIFMFLWFKFNFKSLLIKSPTFDITHKGINNREVQINTGWISAIQSTEKWLNGNWKVPDWHSYAIQSPVQTFKLTEINGKDSSCDFFPFHIRCVSLTSQLYIPWIPAVNAQSHFKMSHY